MKAKMSDSKQILRKREGAWGVGWKEEERGEEEAEGMCYCVRSCVSECVCVCACLFVCTPAVGHREMG